MYRVSGFTSFKKRKDKIMATVITGKENIQAYRLMVLRTGLKAEINGMRLTRGRTCYAVIKEEFGLRGNKQNVLNQYEDLLRDLGVLIDEEKKG